MDKATQGSGIDDALRDLTKRRDRVLGKAPPLSPTRQTALKAALAGQFPVETALHEVATKRDQLLEFRPSGIPAHVDSALRRPLFASSPGNVAIEGGRAFNWRLGVSVWLSFLRWPIRAAMTASALIATAILWVGWEPSSRQSTQNLPHASPTEWLTLDARPRLDRSPLGKAELFARKMAIAQFSLSTTEPASLQASFLADGNQASPGLRLDLPTKLTLMEDGLTRIP